MSNFISIVIPIYNEALSLKELHKKLLKVLKEINFVFEIIFVDDGSTDQSLEILKSLSPVRILRLRRNYGQTIALATGINAAKGNIIITMDGDLENDPEDIPLLLEKMNEGYDVVSGWRKNRWQRAFFTRRLPSFLANFFLSRLSGLHLHDFGCMFKAYRRETFDNISFSGDMHRLLIAYMAKQGAKITEVPVKFMPRKYGKSHYGIKRILHVLLDSFAFLFFEKYHNKPLYFFGIAAFISLCVSFLIFLGMLFLKFYKGIAFILTPLPILATLFIILGAQFILMGLIAELIYRFYKNQATSSINNYIKEEIDL